MTTNDIGTADWLAVELCRARILEPERLEPIFERARSESPFGDATDLATALVAAGLLTRFQADRALEGNARILLVGPYVLTDAVGAGSLGTVYRAVGRSDGRDYAVKVLPSRGAWNGRSARRIARAFAELPGHPAVVSLLDVGTSPAGHYLVWPFIDGFPLENLVRRHGRLPAGLVAQIGLQAAAALAHVHRHRLVHGLVKPSNLMLGADDRVRLLDFGLGALLADAGEEESLMDTLSSTNTTAGMLDCASPESLLDPTARTPAGDQYGLGCVLYFCMTGRYPFPDGNAVEKMLAHQTQQPPPIRALNPTIPPALAGVVEQLMQKSPGARFRGMEELATALRPLAGAPAAVEDPTPPPGQAPEVLRRAFPPARELPPSLVETPRPTAPLRLSAVPARLPETLAPATPPRPPARPILPPPPPGARPSTLGRFLAALAFWQPAADPVVCTIFTPPSVQPGQTVQILVYAHPAEALLPVDTLARAALPGVEWLASGWTARPVPVGADLALHLGTGNGIGVTEPLRSVNWLSHPTGLRFELFVPWECPAGPVSCVLSLGLGGRLAGKVEFHLPVATAEPR